jgi:hypothetical protein
MQRKPTRQSRGPNADEKAFQAWLKGRLGITGGEGLTEVHHCVGSSVKKNKIHIGHWFCIPLSQSSHWLFHNRKREWKKSFGVQSFLWEIEIINYSNETGREPPNDVYDAILETGK